MILCIVIEVPPHCRQNHAAAKITTSSRIRRVLAVNSNEFVPSPQFERLPCALLMKPEIGSLRPSTCGGSIGGTDTGRVLAQYSL